MTSLIDTLWQDRVTTAASKSTITFDERSAAHYEPLIRRVQDALRASGQADVPSNGEFDEPTRQAMRLYQASVGLEPTGFPDQKSLWRLLRD